jgi:ATP-dependent Clp protease, protease subunit
MNKLLAIAGSALILAAVIGYSASTNRQDNGTASNVIRRPANAVLDLSNTALPNKSEKVESTNITLTKANSVLFRDEVNSQSIAKLQKDIQSKANKLKGKPLYLVLDTPGGDITAGYDLIDFVQGESLNVKTITQFSASMGAYISQSLGERLVTPHGTFMFHRARVEGVGGQLPGEFLTRAGVLLNLVTVMEKQNAARMGISFEEYTKLVKDEYWVSGEEAVKQGIADRVATIQCGEDLQGEHTEQVQVFVFTLNVTYSNCPAIRGPLDVKLANEVNSPQEEAQAKEVIRDFIYNRGIKKATSL